MSHYIKWLCSLLQRLLFICNCCVLVNRVIPPCASLSLSVRIMLLHISHTQVLPPQQNIVWSIPHWRPPHSQHGDGDDSPQLSEGVVSISFLFLLFCERDVYKYIHIYIPHYNEQEDVVLRYPCSGTYRLPFFSTLHFKKWHHQHSPWVQQRMWMYVST